VLEFFKTNSDANYGIITGSASGLVVLDVDGKKGRASLRKMKKMHGPLKTVTVKSPRGYHLYFRTDAAGLIRNSAGKLGPGLDIRGSGGYIVGVGSVNAEGARYRYAEGLSPKEVDIQPLPEWLGDLLAKPATKASSSEAPAIPADQVKAAQRYAQAAQRRELERLARAPNGQRNHTLNASAFRLGQLLAHPGLLVEADVVAELTRTAKALALEEAEIEPTIRSGLDAGRRSPRDLSHLGKRQNPQSPGEIVSTVDEQIAQELAKLGETDSDNAARLAKRFGHHLLFCPGLGYLVWTGSHWCQDACIERYALAQQTARLIADEAPHLPTNDQRATRQNFAQSSLSKGALDRMLELAKPLISVEREKLDADPMLLAVLNGTLDLRTGTLEPHDPRDLITKVVPTNFDPEAKCPRWRQFLHQATGGDRDLQLYLRRAGGYSLTGENGEQIFFLMKGGGGTGKGVFLNTLRNLLGSYGQNTPFETFVVKTHTQIPADLAALRGARMVTASEANFGQQIDEAKIKAFTGGDLITARFLHGNFFTFQPTGKLWLATNDFPRVRSTSDAFWRRVRVIPFTSTVSEDQKDPHLGDKLKAEFPGILAWAVRGCRSWQKNGLGLCPAVNAGTQLWQKGADHFLRFAEDCLIREADAVLASSALYQHYQAWCRRHGEEPLSVKALHARMVEFNVTYKKTNTRREWRGVRLKP
jgi:putative DNA primase/helicase